MAKQRMPQPEKKKGDVSNRPGADTEREHPRRESQGEMPERHGSERGQPQHWRPEGEGDQNE